MPKQFIMEGTGSASLLEIDGLFHENSMVMTYFDGPNSNRTVEICDIGLQEIPQVVESYHPFTKNICQSSEKLAAVGVYPLKDWPAPFSDGNTNEDHSYVSMPTQEIDCSKLNCMDEELFPESMQIPKADKLDSAEKDSGCFETDIEETPAVNHGKNCEPEFIPQMCGKKKNPPYLVSCTVQYLNDAFSISCN